MATILKSEIRKFQESPNKIDNYRIFTDVSRIKKGINPENLNFDLRQLNPRCCGFATHSNSFICNKSISITTSLLIFLIIFVALLDLQSEPLSPILKFAFYRNISYTRLTDGQVYFPYRKLEIEERMDRTRKYYNQRNLQASFKL